MSRPLRFLHLTTFYPPYSFGGDAMYIYRLCHALGDEGHHVDVVHCRDSYHMQHPAEPEIHFDDHPRVRTFPLRSRFGRLSPLATQQTGRPWFKGRAIRQLLAENDYDVIEFHNTSLIGPTAFAWEPRHRRAVKLYFTHEHWLICPTHVLYKFNERPCEKPECLKCTLLARRPPQLWRYTGLLRRMSRHIDRFVSPSRFTARMHAERGFSQPVGHLPYFIDLTDSDWRSPAPRPHPRPYFLFVGRLEQIKGLQTLLTLWDRVPEADLLVAGAGNHEAELKKLAGDNPHQVPRAPAAERTRCILLPLAGLPRALNHLRNFRHHRHRGLRAQNACDLSRFGPRCPKSSTTVGAVSSIDRMRSFCRR